MPTIKIVPGSKSLKINPYAPRNSRSSSVGEWRNIPGMKKLVICHNTASTLPTINKLAELICLSFLMSRVPMNKLKKEVNKTKSDRKRSRK